MTMVADWHEERGHSLVAALGEAAVARLMLRFEAELAALAAEVGEAPETELALRLHRLAGAAASLGLDSAAAALAGGEGRERAAVATAIVEARGCAERGRAALVAAHPGIAGHVPGTRPGVLKA